MFVTCHINFWSLSNFFRVSFEVTRTIRNNKQHFTWGCSILLLKKGKGPWDRISFLFTSLAGHYSQNVFRGFSILVYIGVQVFFRGFFYFLLLLLHVTRSRARLALTSVWPKKVEKLRLFCRSRLPQWGEVAWKLQEQ